MGYLLIHIFFVMLIVVCGWGLLLAWIIGGMLRLVFRGFSRLTGARPAEPQTLFDPTMRRCAGLRCRAMNPAQANFCRRCGRPLLRTNANARFVVSNSTGTWARREREWST